MLSEYQQRLRDKKLGLVFDAPKVPKPLKRVSDKQKLKVADARPEKELLDEWFEARRKDLTGWCKCGCGEKSSKKDDTWYRASIAHIFPKSIFHSVKIHPLNYVERAVFGGCHTNMDSQSMDNWVGMEDWDAIKIKFHLLSPLLTKEEKATKFYSQLERLVNEN